MLVSRGKSFQNIHLPQKKPRHNRLLPHPRRRLLRLLRALCRPEKRQAVLDVFLRDTTTLGVREHRCSRTALQRSVSETDSPWGPVRCKQAGGYGVSRKKYEFDDLARIARETGLSLPELLEKLP